MISEKDWSIANKAFELACNRRRVGGARTCAILPLNGLLHEGFNTYKTHPLQARFGKNSRAICLHAEIDAIRRALYLNQPGFLEGTTLYVVRAKTLENRKMGFGLAKPCVGCTRAIVHFGITRVVYSTDEQTLEEL